MAMTDPKLFWFSPDTAHLHLAGIDVAKCLEKHKKRLMLADYKDAKRDPALKFPENIFDLGDGEIDFPACHRLLKSIAFKGWLCVDLDIARKGPRASYEHCGEYAVEKLEPIYV
jgi:sugar phosphate isomerase/epimerase